MSSPLVDFFQEGAAVLDLFQEKENLDLNLESALIVATPAQCTNTMSEKAQEESILAKDFSHDVKTPGG